MTAQLREQLAARRAEVIAFLSSGRTIPPSFAQRRFWTLQQANPGEAFYNVPFAFQLSGPLDLGLLGHSFNQIVSRHESLRTTLQQIDGELLQVIAPGGEIALSNASVQNSADVDQLLQSEIRRPFDLSREFGLRALLVEVDAEEHVLLLCFHNTLYDQSSLLVLLRELSAHYQGLTLPEPAQYADYVRWQASLPVTGAAERLEFWRQWFARGEPPSWTWTRREPAPLVPSFETHVTWLRCAPDFSRRIQSLSRLHGVTTYVTLLTAYAIVLRRYTNCADLVIGTTYSNRHHWRFATLIGATIDVPALRIDMRDDPELPTLLARVRSVVTDALTYQDVPFELVARELDPPRHPAGPLFRVVFSFFPETPHDELKLPGVTAGYLDEVINPLSRPDLYLVFLEHKTGGDDVLTGYWMHKRDVFSRETAERMSEDLASVLNAMTSERIVW